MATATSAATASVMSAAVARRSSKPRAMSPACERDALSIWSMVLLVAGLQRCICPLALRLGAVILASITIVGQGLGSRESFITADTA